MSSAKNNNCRFYEKEIPDVGDLVMVKVTQVTDTAAYADLLEYNGMEGMLPFTELTRKGFIKSIAKFVKVGKLEVAQVLRVDKQKGYIDLSKKQVTEHERRQCEEMFAKSKLVHSVMLHGSMETQTPLPEIMSTVAWPLYRSHGHAFDALKIAVTDPAAILGPLAISDKLREVIARSVVHRLKSKPSKLRVDLEVTNFTSKGIDAIKEVLLLGKNAGGVESGQLPIEVTIVAPPQYILRTQTESKDEGLKKLIEVVEQMQREMARLGGKVEVTVPPRVVGDDGEDVKPDGDEPKDDSDSGDE